MFATNLIGLTIHATGGRTVICCALALFGYVPRANPQMDSRQARVFLNIAEFISVVKGKSTGNSFYHMDRFLFPCGCHLKPPNRRGVPQTKTRLDGIPTSHTLQWLVSSCQAGAELRGVSTEGAKLDQCTALEKVVHHPLPGCFSLLLW